LETADRYRTRKDRVSLAHPPAKRLCSSPNMSHAATVGF
jgi:hypothetical protein